MKKTLLEYLVFMGVYPVVMIVAEVIPVEVQEIVAMGIGVLGMIASYVYLALRSDFKRDHFYIANLVFIFLFGGFTIFYDMAFGLTDVSVHGGAASFSNSKFYMWSLSINQALIPGTLIIFIHSLFTLKLKSVLIALSGVGLLFLYFLVIAL